MSLTTKAHIKRAIEASGPNVDPALMRRAVLALWNELEAMAAQNGSDSRTISITADDEISIRAGDASILMKKDGTIRISGKDVMIDASGKVNVKGSSDVVIRGSKILQN